MHKQCNELYTFSDYRNSFEDFKEISSKDNISKCVSDSKAKNEALSIPHVLCPISELVIYTNQITKIENEYVLKLNKINIRLLNEEEYNNLLERLLKETLNKETLKDFKKYIALKHITN